MRLLVVEDHSVVLDGLQLLLERRFPEAVITGVGTLADAKKSLTESPCDLVLLDCYLPDSTGAASVRSLKAISPELPVVVLTGERDESQRQQVLEAGAVGYLSKGGSAEELAEALRLASVGEQIPSSQPTVTTVPGLTPRQMEVLRCLSRGLTNKEIAQELGSAESTVRVHVTAILRVLGVTNRTEAALAARRILA